MRIVKEENRLLEVELRLAPKGISYIVLDALKEKMVLKNRGILLREFKIVRIGSWGGNGLAIEPIPLIKKRAFSSPERKEIKPHKQPEGTDSTTADTSAKEEFLELKDMPYRYTLLFAKGVSISVRARPEGAVSKLACLIESMLRHIYHSFVVVWNYLWKKDDTIIELMMDKEEAQALYWTSGEGTPIVVLGEAPARSRLGWSLSLISCF